MVEVPELFGRSYCWLRCQNLWLNIFLVEVSEPLAEYIVG